MAALPSGSHVDARRSSHDGPESETVTTFSKVLVAHIPGRRAAVRAKSQDDTQNEPVATIPFITVNEWEGITLSAEGTMTAEASLKDPATKPFATISFSCIVSQSGEELLHWYRYKWLLPLLAEHKATGDWVAAQAHLVPLIQAFARTFSSSRHVAECKILAEERRGKERQRKEATERCDRASSTSAKKCSHFQYNF